MDLKKIDAFAFKHFLVFFLITLFCINNLIYSTIRGFFTTIDFLDVLAIILLVVTFCFALKGISFTFSKFIIINIILSIILSIYLAHIPLIERNKRIIYYCSLIFGNLLFYLLLSIFIKKEERNKLSNKVNFILVKIIKIQALIMILAGGRVIAYLPQVLLSLNSYPIKLLFQNLSVILLVILFPIIFILKRKKQNPLFGFMLISNLFFGLIFESIALANIIGISSENADAICIISFTLFNIIIYLMKKLIIKKTGQVIVCG